MVCIIADRDTFWVLPFLVNPAFWNECNNRLRLVSPRIALDLNEESLWSLEKTSHTAYGTKATGVAFIQPC